MAECCACGCGGCAGCTTSSSVCACGAVGAFTESGYNGYASIQGGVYGQITPKQQARLKKMIDDFNGRHVKYKDWSITMRADHINGWYGYMATKQGEAKRIEKDSFKEVEKAVDNFNSEGGLHKAIDRIL